MPSTLSHSKSTRQTAARGKYWRWIGLATLLMLLTWLPDALAADKLRLQLRWLHQFQFAGYYMALERGFYKDAGLDVEILEGGPGARKPIDSMLAGEVDFAIANSGVVIARIAGKPVVALSAIMQTSPLVWIVRADSDIYTPHDLLGKRLMLMAAPESAELLITLRREGVDLSALDIKPTSFRIQDLVEGKTDAYNGYISNEPFWLTQQGMNYRLINPRDYGVNFYSDVLTTSEELLQKKPEQVEAFVQASLKGWKYALEHAEETARLIQSRYAPDKHLDHLRFEAKALNNLIMPELVQLGHMNPSRWEYIANSYVQLGMASGPINLEGFIYTAKAKTDYQLLYRLAAGALLALLVVGALALRFARLTRRLRREVRLRQLAEQELIDSNTQLERLANTDRLTGLWNRLKFEEVALNEIKRAERYDFPLALVFFDIDRFKWINDQHGHEVGDSVLIGLAKLVQSHLRDSDSLCRWGGEEFIMLMPHTDLTQAGAIAEKLRVLLAETPLLAGSTVTASFGVTQWKPQQGLHDLVRMADLALYRAKELGRNRIECVTPEELA